MGGLTNRELPNRAATFDLSIGDGVTGAAAMSAYHNTATVAPFLSLSRARGSLASPSQAQSGDVIGIIGCDPYGDTGFSGVAGASYQMIADELQTSTQRGAGLAFKIQRIGFTTRFTTGRLYGSGRMAFAGSAAAAPTDDGTSGFYVAAPIRTGNIGATTSVPWRLGTVKAGVVALDAANYVEVEINGVVVKLLKAA